MSFKRHLTVGTLILSVLSGCDNSFNPKTDFSEELVVYSVLDNTLDMQVVRLSTTFDAELGNVDAFSGRPIDEATVIIRGGGSRYDFRDTTVTLSDGTTEKIWINSELEPRPERQYRLQVQAEGFPEATSAFTMPSNPIARIQVRHTSLSIDSVMLYAGALNFVERPKGFYLRLFLVYRDTLDGEYIEKVAEVPVEQLSGSDELLYPTIGREERQGFSKYHLNNTLYSLTTDKSRFGNVGAVGYIYVIEADFYNYYKLVRGFDDPASVRLDKPDYSNIDGARGVFGGVYRDTTYTQLYKFFRP